MAQAGNTMAEDETGEAIDRAHLRQMTFADTALEREVLGLFDRQAAALLKELPQAAPGELPALAHAVKGAARGIGAWRVARAAAVVETSPRADTGELAAALTEARAAIATILQWH